MEVIFINLQLYLVKEIILNFAILKNAEIY